MDYEVMTVSTVQLDQTATQVLPGHRELQEKVDLEVDLDETERMELVDELEMPVLLDHMVLLANLDQTDSSEQLASKA